MLSTAGGPGSWAAEPPALHRGAAGGKMEEYDASARGGGKRGGLPRKPRRAALCLGTGQRPEDQPFAVRRNIYLDLVSPAEVAHEDLLAQRVLDVALDGTLQRAGSVVLVVAVLDQEFVAAGVSLTSSPRRRCTSRSRMVTICAM